MVAASQQGFRHARPASLVNPLESENENGSGEGTRATDLIQISTRVGFKPSQRIQLVVCHVVDDL